MSERCRLGLFVLLSASVVLLAGCNSAPQTMKASGLEGETRVAAGEFWERRGLEPIGEGGGRRVAVVEFSVEYVVEKLEMPGKKQPKVFGTEYGMTGFAATTVGLGRTHVVFDDEIKRRLPGVLYGQFETELERAGFVVIPAAEVAKAAAYLRFKTRKSGSSSLVRRLDIGGSDTGNPKRTETYPARGLAIIKGEGSKTFDAASAAIMNELKADAVLAVKVRLGLYAGHASVERGSRIWVTTADESGQLWATHSLLSEEVVAEAGKFRLFRGKFYELDSDKYAQAVETIFPAYISLAPEELK